MSGHLPTVNRASVSLIKPIVLPDLLTRFRELWPGFSFLASATDYAQYYKDNEWSKSKRVQYDQPAVVPGLGQLWPLKRSHTMHSYWKSFRRSVEMEQSKGRVLNELFLLLPLKIDIPINPLGVNGRHFRARAYMYLFPFGCCVTNVDVRVTDMPLGDIVENLIPNLKRTSISRVLPAGRQDMGSFKRFSNELTNQMNAELFKAANNLEEEHSAHTFVFIEESLGILSDTAPSHKNAMAAAMKGLTLNDVARQTEDKRAEYLGKPMSKLRPQEISFFTDTGSFFYASPNWDKIVPNKPGDRDQIVKRKKISRKINCMRNNYQSCLNVLFAVNKVLNHSVMENRKVPSDKLEELKRSFGEAFPVGDSRFHFKHIFEQVAPEISLKERLDKMRES